MVDRLFNRPMNTVRVPASNAYQFRYIVLRLISQGPCSLLKRSLGGSATPCLLLWQLEAAAEAFPRAAVATLPHIAVSFSPSFCFLKKAEEPLRQNSDTGKMASQEATQEYSDEYIGHILVIVAILFIVLEGIFVGLRFISRHLAKTTWGLDDTFIIPSLLFCWGIAILSLGRFIASTPSHGETDIKK